MEINRIFGALREKTVIKDKKVDYLVPVNVMDRETGVITQRWKYEHRGLWCYVRDVYADEILYSDLPFKVYSNDKMFLINYREGLSNEHRLYYKGEVYDIIKIDYFEGNKEDIIIIARQQNVRNNSGNTQSSTSENNAQ